MNHVPARLRAPLKIVVLGLAVGAVDIATRGWALVPVVILACVVAAAAVGFYVWGGGESDTAASLRRERDERQLLRSLKIQALAGRISALAAAVAMVVAVCVGVTTWWPFVVALAVPVLAAAAGWFIYTDRAPHA
jgi:uncharacterized membrane protein